MTTQSHDFLISRAERKAFELAWRRYLLTARNVDAAAFALQAILRGKDPRRAFASVSNPTKLANGQKASQGYAAAVAQLHRQLGTYVHAIWPELMGNGRGPTRYEEVLQALTVALDTLRKGA